MIHHLLYRIDGALQPWTDGLLKILLELCPLPPGTEIIPDNTLPHPRALLRNATQATLEASADPLKTDIQYRKATVQENRRMTATDWYQDVRHLEFRFDDNIRCFSLLHCSTFSFKRS